ncbi:MAG TPA: glycosyltransferase family protein [Bacteroidia bacterium]|nr:glycosyltransferase family protein [Bacteroidia bacterium]
MKKRILISPLDWGLGHATRIVPVMRELEKQGAEVIIAAGGRPYYFLKKAFPGNEIIEAGGYDITYPRNGNLGLHLLKKLPGMARKVKEEKKLAEKIAAEKNIDIIISDNRFAFFSERTHNVYITHQLNVKTPKGFGIANAIHRKYFGKFDEVWVPDFPGAENLSGSLGHGTEHKKNTFYVGPLSRFSERISSVQEKKWQVIALLSGPEPQRTMFEEKIIEQAADLNGRVLIVRGTPEEKEEAKSAESTVVLKNHLADEELVAEISSAEVVLSRGGYTTLCDLFYLGVPFVAVPTPGQTEQEYLAALHSANGNLFTMTQEKFSLREAFEKGKNLEPISIHDNERRLERAVKELLQK